MGGTKKRTGGMKYKKKMGGTKKRTGVPEEALEVDVEDVHANAVNAHHAIGVN